MYLVFSFVFVMSFCFNAFANISKVDNKTLKRIDQVETYFNIDKLEGNCAAVESQVKAIELIKETFIANQQSKLDEISQKQIACEIALDNAKAILEGKKVIGANWIELDLIAK